jgi:hypothetical protein
MSNYRLLFLEQNALAYYAKVLIMTRGFCEIFPRKIDKENKSLKVDLLFQAAVLEAP